MSSGVSRQPKAILMKSELAPINLIIRLANEGDLRAVFELANEESVRVNSFHSERIGLDNHKKWFTKKITDPNYLFLIAELDSHFAGQVRFEIKDDNAVVGISLLPTERGKGVATKLLKQGIDYLTEHHPNIKTVKAFIKPDNQASIKLFERVGFKFKDKVIENDSDALLYHLKPGEKDGD